MEDTTGYKGHSLVESDDSTSYLVSPTGVRIASFSMYWGEDMPDIQPLIDGLDCGRDHANVEQAIRHIVDQYELMTTTGWERFSKRVYGFFDRGIGVAIVAVAAVVGAIAAIVAAVASILTYLNTLANTIPPP